MANEYGGLFKGYGRNKDGSQRVEGMNVCHWIRRSQVPKGKKQRRTIGQLQIFH